MIILGAGLVMGSLLCASWVCGHHMGHSSALQAVRAREQS